MKDEDKAKEQLIKELVELRQQIIELKASETLHKRMEEKIKDYTENLEKMVEKRTKALRESEERLQAILTGIGDYITIQNSDLDIIWVNQPVRDIWGDIIGKKCYEVYKGLTAPCTDCTVEKVLNAEKTVVLEGFRILPDGRHTHVLITGSPLRDAEGNIVAVVEVLKDITARKQLERQLEDYTENLEKIVEKRTKALSESKAKLRSILAGIGDFITIQNKDLDIIWANQLIRELWGEIVGKKCYKAYKGLTEPCPECTVEKVFKEGKTTVSERVITLPDGTLMHVLVTSSPVRDAEGNIIAVVEVDKDITERKRIEEELRKTYESREELERIINRSPAIVFLWRAAEGWPVEYVSNSVQQFGYAPEDFYSGHLPFANIIHPDDLDSINAEVYQYSQEGRKHYDQEYRIITKTGEVRWLEDRTWVRRDLNGIITHYQGIALDITDRKKAEEKIKEYTENLETLVEDRTKALRESEAKLQAILAGIGDLITIQNKDLGIIWANQPIKDLWGDVIGKKCYEVYKGLTAPCSECTVEKVVNEEKIVVSEQVNILPDGGRMHVLVTSSPVRDAEGNIVAVVEVEKDITKRKQLELQLKDYTENLEKIVEERTKALRESEERLQAILTGIGDLITIQNKDLGIIWANQPIKDLWGDVIGKKCYEVYKGLTAPCSECTVEKVFNEEKTFASEQSFISSDGQRIHTLVTSSPVRDAEGNIVTVVEVIKDITERKKLERQLIESEERYRGLYESSIDGIASVDMEGNIVECNQAYADMLGYTKEELYNLKLLEITPSKWHAMNQKIVAEQVYTRGYSDEFEIERIKKDGTIIPVSVRVWLIKDKDGKPSGTWGIVRDITERKKLELQLKNYTEKLEKLVKERTLKLKESEERYRGLYESSIDGIASVDMDGNIVECNQAFVNMLEYTKEELYEFNYQELTPSKWSDMETKIFTEQIIPRGYSDVYEKEFIKKDGRIFPVSVRLWLVKDKEGNPIGVWCIVRDITERKKLERKLKQYTKNLEASEERYRGLYEASIDGIVFVDMEENILECNQAFADMLGYTKEELHNLNYQELTPSKWRNMYEKIFAEKVLPKDFSDVYEKELIKKDGTIVPVSVRGWRITDKDDVPTCGWAIVRDITERKQAEETIKEYTEHLEKLVQERTLELSDSEKRY